MVVAHLESGTEPVLSSASQPKVPPLQVKTLLVWQVERPAPLNKAVKRLEDEAVVLKIEVEVALVEVELEAVKFCKVEEEFTKRLPKVPRPVEVRELRVRRPFWFKKKAD